MTNLPNRSHRLRAVAITSLVASMAIGALFACRSFAAPSEKLPNVDLGKLGEDELKGFYDVAGKEPSPCKLGESLLDSLRKGGCPLAVYGGRYLVRLEKAELVPSEVTQYYEWRFLAKPVKVDVANAPMAGDPHAAVTLVEFADFQCPHCRVLQPEMKKVLALYPKEVRLYFKNFPLGQHERSMAAAIAAEAAGRQGKFWEMEALLFEHQDQLESSDIDGYAKQIGLDLDRFHADVASEGVKSQVLKDRSDADALKLDGTPAVFVNGVEMHGPKSFDEISDWVDAALGRPPGPERAD